MTTAPRTVLVLCDSLAFHGPARAELTTDARLWPNVMARTLSSPAGGERAVAPEAGFRAVIYGRRGWTSRDAWFALTKDPYLYTELLPEASAVILAVGGMDYLPSIMPTHWREGLRLLRPRPVRRLATSAYRRALPLGARVSGGRWRTLPRRATEHYLSRCVEGIRYFHPSIPVFGVVPPDHRAAGYGRVRRGHPLAVRSALEWGRAHGVPVLRQDLWVSGHLGTDGMNPDGIHWGWDCHREVGERSADQLRPVLRARPSDLV